MHGLRDLNYLNIPYNNDSSIEGSEYWRKLIGKIVTVTVDRPIGSYHPVHKNLYYPINYGYVKGIIAQDGEEQDAYVIGVDVPVKEYTGKVIAVIHRNDDVEEKWVVCPEDRAFTKEEIEEIVRFQEQFFDSVVIMSM